MFNRIRQEKRFQYAIWGTILAGILAHGFMMTNKISFHDDIATLFDIGMTWKAGRWTLGIIEFILSSTVGKYSMPFWEIWVSLCLLSLTAVLIVDLLDIKKGWCCFLIGAILAVFPVTAVIYMFMFTAGSYFLGLFLAVWGVWLAERYKFGWIGTIICTALMLGVYQAFICTEITLIICLLITKCLEDSKEGGIVYAAVKYMLVEVIGLLCYYQIVKITLRFTGNHLTGYQGINSMMKLAIKDRLKRVSLCYTDLLRMFYGDVHGLTGNVIIHLFLICIVILVLVLIINKLLQINKIFNKITYILLILALPIGINLIYPMTTDETAISAIVRYSLVWIWIISMLFVQLCDEEGKENIAWKKLISKPIIVCCAGSILYYAYLDNSVYMKANFLQEQTTSYFTTLITQIKSCDEYKDELPVLYVGNWEINDSTLTVQNEKYQNTQLTLFSYDLREWVNNNSYQAYMSYHCGFSPSIVNIDDVYDWEKIDEMPTYPDYGSIKVIDGMVVVKFAERVRE